MRVFYVYVMASRSRVLYTGVTNDLSRRVNEHKRGLTPGADIRDAIAREKQIKAWTHARRISLVEGRNPTWQDLAQDSFPGPTVP